MSNNKVVFLKALLNDSRLTEAHYSRINYLLGSPTKKTKKAKVKKHCPKETRDFLSLFGNNDGCLKFLTHNFANGSLDYEKFIDQCQREFNAAVEEYPNVPDPLLSRIKQFAFSSEPNWYVRKGHEDKDKIWIKNGWKSAEFIEWYKKNRVHPFTDSEKWKPEMIEPFKNSIQIREGFGSLADIINTIAQQKDNRNLIIDIDKSVDKAVFYTDVDMLTCALSFIIYTISKEAEKNFIPYVEVKYNIEERTKYLYITHVGSSTEKEVHLGGDFNIIKSNLYGLCNYEIKGSFGNGNYRIIVLSDNTQEREGTFKKLSENEILKGFTHILKFY